MTDDAPDAAPTGPTPGQETTAPKPPTDPAPGVDAPGRQGEQPATPASPVADPPPAPAD